MGLRFQRRMRLLPGVHLNLSRSGVGLSVGGRGAHIGITARGQRYTSVGIPGTGLSWREYQHKPPAPPLAGRGRIGGTRTEPPKDIPTLAGRGNHIAPPAPHRCDLCQPGHVHVHIGGLFLVLLAGLVVFLAGAWLGRP